ncbi:helix-turn-helix domain-containing protein [Bradyrhizobium frederickii]|nr:AraC family transcriptional regulator [Bradyrhizobium frederickii]
MRVRLASSLTISHIAAECRLTPSHFARCFRRSTGVAPHEYLSQLRVKEAKRLMTTTKLPLADIALICGFGDQSYFVRVFSRRVGTSPGAWRRARSEG